MFVVRVFHDSGEVSVHLAVSYRTNCKDDHGDDCLIRFTEPRHGSMWPQEITFYEYHLSGVRVEKPNGAIDFEWDKPA